MAWFGFKSGLSLALRGHTVRKWQRARVFISNSAPVRYRLLQKEGKARTEGKSGQRDGEQAGERASGQAKNSQGHGQQLPRAPRLAGSYGAEKRSGRSKDSLTQRNSQPQGLQSWLRRVGLSECIGWGGFLVWGWACVRPAGSLLLVLSLNLLRRDCVERRAGGRSGGRAARGALLGWSNTNKKRGGLHEQLAFAMGATTLRKWGALPCPWGGKQEVKSRKHQRREQGATKGRKRGMDERKLMGGAFDGRIIAHFHWARR